MKTITSHYQTRAQQRGISNLLRAVVEIYGHDYFGRGCTFISTKKSKKVRNKMLRDLRSAVEYFESGRDVFEIQSQEGILITCGHHLKRSRS